MNITQGVVQVVLYISCGDGSILGVENPVSVYCGLDGDGKLIPCDLKEILDLSMWSSLLPPEKDELCSYVEIKNWTPQGLEFVRQRFADKRITSSRLPDTDSTGCVVHTRMNQPGYAESRTLCPNYLVPFYKLIKLMPCPSDETNILNCPRGNSLKKFDEKLKEAMSPPSYPPSSMEQREEAMRGAYRMAINLVDTTNIWYLNEFVEDTCVFGTNSERINLDNDWILRRAFIYAITAFQEKPMTDEGECGFLNEAIRNLRHFMNPSLSKEDRTAAKFIAMSSLDQLYGKITGHALPGLGGKHEKLT